MLQHWRRASEANEPNYTKSVQIHFPRFFGLKSLKNPDMITFFNEARFARILEK